MHMLCYSVYRFTRTVWLRAIIYFTFLYLPRYCIIFILFLSLHLLARLLAQTAVCIRMNIFFRWAFVCLFAI